MAISGASGNQNMKCYISPESREDELCDSGVSFCTGISQFELHEVFYQVPKVQPYSYQEVQIFFLSR